MIGRADLVERVREWGLAEQVVEKDYVLGWVLWGIGSDRDLADRWVFKGGTCLKKCYIETYRFSEDLDFTVLPGGPVQPDEVLPLLRRALDRVGEEPGIDFSAEEPRFRVRPSGLAAEGRVYYRGPRQTPGATSTKIDLSADERVVRPPVLRPVAHPYPDALPGAGTVRCYSFEEVFAEKLRAMGQRGRPRDLYDIVNLFRRNDLRMHAAVIHDVLVEKCEAKSGGRAALRGTAPAAAAPGAGGPACWCPFRLEFCPVRGGGHGLEGRHLHHLLPGLTHASRDVPLAAGSRLQRLGPADRAVLAAPHPRWQPRAPRGGARTTESTARTGSTGCRLSRSRPSRSARSTRSSRLRGNSRPQ